MRKIGKLGRMPGRRPTGLRDLTYYAAGPLPQAPSDVQFPPNVSWMMLGNNQYGDCGVASLEHVFMADAALTRESEEFPDTAQAVDYYLKYTGGQDSGVVLATYLLYVHKNGYYGHKVGAFAPVHVQDLSTLRFSIWAYGAAYCGIVVTTAMQQAFKNHEPWTVKTLDSSVVGGHAVPFVGYSEGFFYLVTWGGIQSLSYAAWAEMTHLGDTEAFAVLTGELKDHNGDDRGISYSALATDLSRL